MRQKSINTFARREMFMWTGLLFCAAHSPFALLFLLPPLPHLLFPPSLPLSPPGWCEVQRCNVTTRKRRKKEQAREMASFLIPMVCAFLVLWVIVAGVSWRFAGRFKYKRLEHDHILSFFFEFKFLFFPPSCSFFRVDGEKWSASSLFSNDFFVIKEFLYFIFIFSLLFVNLVCSLIPFVSYLIFYLFFCKNCIWFFARVAYMEHFYTKRFVHTTWFKQLSKKKVKMLEIFGIVYLKSNFPLSLSLAYFRFISPFTYFVFPLFKRIWKSINNFEKLWLNMKIYNTTVYSLCAVR